MYILGISAYYHDSAAALIKDGKIIAAAQEERFTRKKHDPSFPSNAIHFCLEYAGIELKDVAVLSFYDKPLLKFERLLETYYGFAPKGLRSFIQAMPVWLREKLFLKREIYQELNKIGTFDKKKLKLLFPEHHLSHAASAFYPSPFDKAVILTLDGVGEWSTASICYGDGKDIRILKELHFPHSLGLLYSAFTYYLGFRVNSGEYKLMGLAPYGSPDDPEVDRFAELIKTHLIAIQEDGSLWLDQQYFNYATGLRMVYDKKWEKLFGFPKRPAESQLSQQHCNLALAIQRVTEEVVIKMAQAAQSLTGAEYLCMAGGVALNCVANGKLLNKGIFKDIFIQPAAGDAGGAPGAALAAYHLYFQKDRKLVVPDAMLGSLLGPELRNHEIKSLARSHVGPVEHYEKEQELCKVVAKLIASGKVVGWANGRMEFGPRALGARSILADPRNPEMQQKLNLKIKFRESFRPFAPSVLEEEVSKHFELETASPYMLLVQPVKNSIRNPLPNNYHSMPLMEKLYIERSTMPSITHIDFSARIQSVDGKTNPRYRRLIEEFHQLTGCPALVNTSFNVRGEPIVCTAKDAYRCFQNTGMDVLVMNNFIFQKPPKNIQN